MGADPNETLDVLDPRVMYELISAIINHENGYNPYDYTAIMTGVDEGLDQNQTAPAPSQAV